MPHVIQDEDEGLPLFPEWGKLPPMVFQHPMSLQASELKEMLRQCEMDEETFALRMLQQTFQTYRVGPLLALVQADGDTLVLLSVQSDGIATRDELKGLASGLRRLAHAWGLTQITSSAYEPKVMKTLKWLGAEVVGWHMKLGVEK